MSAYELEDEREQGLALARRKMNANRMRGLILLCTLPGCGGTATHERFARWKCDTCGVRWHIYCEVEIDDEYQGGES